MKITIDSESAGMTVLAYLRQKLGASRRCIIRLKQRENGIMQNGAHVTVRAVLKQGDELTLETEDTEADVNFDITAGAAEPDVVYEDDDIVVCNKPAGMPTHPSFNHHGDSLANSLVAYYEKKKTPFVFRAANRLDNDTSGLVLIAKNMLTAHRLSLLLQSGAVEKNYICILEGRLDPPDGEIKNYIRRCGDSIITREVTEENDGVFAHTVYRTLKSNGRLSLVSASPITGRTHQLRVHFSNAGCPILWDGLYGTDKARLSSRCALHAVSLRFPHPTTGKILELSAPLPEEMMIAGLL